MLCSNEDIKLSGEQIKELRLKHGLSQQEFGARLGVTHAHISKIENGKENPSETLLRLLSYEFGGLSKQREVYPIEQSKELVKKHLEALDEIILNSDMNSACLFQAEFFLANYRTILKETKESPTFQDLLMDSLGGIVDEVALLLEDNNKKIHDENDRALLTSRYRRVEREITACNDGLLALLKETTIGG